MDDIDDLLQRYVNAYQVEQKRIPVELAKYRKEINEEEKELQAAIAAGDRRLIYGYQDMLKHSKYDFISYQEKVSFLREPIKEDIQYRYRQRREFPQKIATLSEDMMLCFHGTDLKGAKHILSSGAISSGADRTGRATSFDPPGLISVTNKDTVDTSVSTYMNIDGNYCYPAGCLFVVTPADKVEYAALSSSGWMIKNVDFKTQPDRLVSVVTTPENIDKVKNWAHLGGVDVSKVMDFDNFVRKYSLQNDKGLSLAVQKSITTKSLDKSS